MSAVLFRLIDLLTIEGQQRDVRSQTLSALPALATLSESA
jgi:hypothetical protein